MSSVNNESPFPDMSLQGSPLERARFIEGVTMANSSERDNVTRTAAAVDQLKPLIPSAKYGDRILTEREFECTTAVDYLLSCEEVKNAIVGDIENIVGDLDFNPLHFIRDFLKYYESEKIKNNEITPIEAFTSYKPNTKDQALIEYGATCVGRSMDIVRYLKQMKSIIGHVVVESIGPNGTPTHAAVIIPCKDGIVLIDSMYAEKVCVIPFTTIIPEEVSMKMDIEDRAHFSFELVQMPSHLTSKEVILHKREVLKDKTVQKQILLRTSFSPDEPIRKNAFLNMGGSYQVYNQLEPDCQLFVIVKEQKIKIKIGRGKDAVRIELPFSAFDPITRTIDRSALSKTEADLFLTGEFFQKMHTKQEIALDEIFLIIKHYETLKSLYGSAGKPF